MKANHWFFLLAAWGKSRRFALLYAALLFGILFFVYGLYRLPWGPAVYASLLGAVAGLLFAMVDFARFAAKHAQLSMLPGRFPTGQLPGESDLLEQDYACVVTELEKERLRLNLQAEQRRREAEEYYALWVHQIKTPIAAMNLLLQQQGSCMEEETRAALGMELFRTEQYAGMVLQYLRLESMHNDLVLRRHKVDALVRRAVKNIAPLFIYKNLPLQLEPLPGEVVTDEKWFVFVLEQILGNALKYTRQGNVRICCEELTLVVEDTGIGIAPEDVSMVFERGFTGAAGRIDSRSTGIGLYLCRQILNGLGIPIAIESQQGVGTRVLLDLRQHQLELD